MNWYELLTVGSIRREVFSQKGRSFSSFWHEVFLRMYLAQGLEVNKRLLIDSLGFMTVNEEISLLDLTQSKYFAHAISSHPPW